MNIACISILSDRGFCFLKILIQHSIGIHIYIKKKNTKFFAHFAMSTLQFLEVLLYLQPLQQIIH